MELKVTKEKVLKAAETCSDAKKVLKELFPEAFDNSVDIPQMGQVLVNGVCIIDKRFHGKYSGKSFWLSGKFNWKIVYDDKGELCLIPTRKD